jgi:hypothetical protein
MIKDKDNFGPAANTLKDPDEVEIYWEKQGLSKLCGLHTINCILQGPFYDEVALIDLKSNFKVKLAEIAKELDDKEKALMAELGTETDDFLNYMAVMKKDIMIIFSKIQSMSQRTEISRFKS